MAVVASVIRVLVAQGDTHTRTVLGWLLAQDERFEVAGLVGSGDEVIRWPDPIAAVLVDIALPGLDALETVRSLRGRYPESTIVIVGGVDAPYLRAVARDAGADGYLNRAVDGARLVDMLAELCAG
jgi:DNA-binding NarL/FixJ family response regulator